MSMHIENKKKIKEFFMHRICSILNTYLKALNYYKKVEKCIYIIL